MSGRLSGDEANAFLRRVQQGELPCLEEFSQPHIPGVAGYQDLLMSANRHGDTALLVAARHGHTAILRQLVETFGVPVQHTNVDGKTALHEAAQNSQVAAVNYLIKAGAKVDSLKIADWTPLMLACTKESAATVAALLQGEASLFLVNKDGWNAFHIACREGHPDILNLLLDFDSRCSETRSNNGRTPLHTLYMAEMKQHGFLQKESPVFWRHRCSYDVDTVDSSAVTPLMDAVRGNHAAMADFLLHQYGRGAQLQCEDVLGRQAVHHAAQAGARAALELLIKEGANVNKPAGMSGSTPLHYAAKEAQSGAISLLLQYGANPSLRDKQGRSALDVAQSARQPQAAVSMLETAFAQHTQLQ